jgi:hypothetical protein
VWLTSLPDLLSMLDGAGLRIRWQEECSESHREMVDALVAAFESDRAEIVAQIGAQALDDLVAAHQLWSDWLSTGRVRKFAFVAEKVA